MIVSADADEIDYLAEFGQEEEPDEIEIGCEDDPDIDYCGDFAGGAVVPFKKPNLVPGTGRSELEHWAICARMRERKASHALKKLKGVVKTTVASGVELVKTTCVGKSASRILAGLSETHDWRP